MTSIAAAPLCRRSHAEQPQYFADGFRSPVDYDPPSDGGVQVTMAVCMSPLRSLSRCPYWLPYRSYRRCGGNASGGLNH